MSDEEIQAYADGIRDQVLRIAEAYRIDVTDPVAMQSLIEHLLKKSGCSLVNGVWRFAQQ